MEENKNNVTEEQPLVSIIVITYNSAKYVLETLESARAQTYQNIELIVSDDCSTDNTIEVCRDWIEANELRFTRVKLVTTEKNAGVPANCNRGINVATGEWVRLIAGDDFLKEDCIEYSIKKAICVSEDCDVYRTRQIDFVVKNQKKEFFYSKEKKSVFYERNITSKQQLVLALRNINPFMASFLFKKKVHVLVDGFDERFRLLEDWPFLIRLLMKGVKIYCDQEVTGFHRIREDSIYNSGAKEKIITDWTLTNYIPVVNTYCQPNISLPEKLLNQYFFSIVKFFYYNLNNKNLINYLLYRFLALPDFLGKKFLRILFTTIVRLQLLFFSK